jgi:hypothetical protein
MGSWHERDESWQEIESEMKRIGFTMLDLGGLALSGGKTLADFKDFLRTIPDNSGYDEFVRRTRNGFEPTDEQLRSNADPELLEDLRGLLRRSLFGVTWSERARWLRLVADDIATTPAPFPEIWTRCSFCGQRREDRPVMAGPSGVGICAECANNARRLLSEED